MSSEKTVIITPLYPPPNPRDFDELCPLARQVMNALELQYADIISACNNNNDDGSGPSETNVFRLSPIPVLENCNQWDNIQITIDTGSRRNKKLIDKSNQNIDQILGKVRENNDVLNLEETKDNVHTVQYVNRPNKSSSTEEPDKKKTKKGKENKIDFKDFQFSRKKKKVLRKSKNTEKQINNKHDLNVVIDETNEPTIINKNHNEENVNLGPVQAQNSTNNIKTRKANTSKISLEQFAFKPQSKNTSNCEETNTSNDINIQNAISKPVEIKTNKNDNVLVKLAENDENNYTNYVPSDDSSNMSFSQESVERNFITGTNADERNIVIDETPACKITGLEELAQKYNASSTTISFDYRPEEIEIQNTFPNLTDDMIVRQNYLQQVIIDETPEYRNRSTLEYLVENHENNCYGSFDVYRQVTEIRNKDRMDNENVKENMNIANNEQILVDAVPQGNEISALALISQMYNDSLSDKSEICKSSHENQNKLINENSSIKQNVIENIHECNRHEIEHKTNINCIHNIENQNTIALKMQNEIQQSNKDIDQSVIDETPQCNQISALDLLAQKYNKSVSLNSTQKSENRYVYPTEKQIIKEIVKEQTVIAETPQCKLLSVLELYAKHHNEKHDTIAESNQKQIVDHEMIQYEKQNPKQDTNIDNYKQDVIDETPQCKYMSALGLLSRKYSENRTEIQNLDNSIKNEKDTKIIAKEKTPDSLNQSVTNNKNEYVENWLNNLEIEDLEFEEYVKPVANKSYPNESQSLNIIPTGTQYIEDWYKDMPEEYSKIKTLFDFDMSTSKDSTSQILDKDLAPAVTLCEMKDKPFLPPEPVRKSNKTKIIQRKTYVLEIDKSKPVLEPKRVQTKITSVFQPITVDIPKQQTETKQANIKDEPKSMDSKFSEMKSRKRKITDHFNVDKIVNKKVKIDEKNEELQKGIQGPKFIKKKYKFFTPVLSQLVEKEVKYEMYTVDDKMAAQMDTYIKQNVPNEICFNIIYKDGFCQLSQPKKAGNIMYTPNGIMMNVSWLTQKLSKSCFTEFYHINLSKSCWNDFAVIRSLIKTCLTMNCRKVCFKAQTLFVLLMNTFAFTAEEVSLEWLVVDPFIGCWVLDPDHPPTTFQGVQSQLETRPNYKATSSEVLIKSCDMLIQLSETTRQLQARLEERDLWTIFVEMELKIVSILSVMEHRGISTNVNILKSFSKTLKEKLDAVEKKAHGIVGRKFLLNSPAQVRSILYDELQLDSANCIEIKGTAASGVKSTSEPMLQLLRKVHPLPGLILEYRHLHKAKSTFVDSMLQHVQNGLVKSTWEHTAAATGRIASSNPNLQAIPKHPFPLNLFPENGDMSSEQTVRLRNAYSSRPGYTLLAADFQHIELRIFAHLSRDTTIINALTSSGDIFKNMAESWLGKKVAVITEEHRDQTKKIVYATIYGAGPGKLADILSVPHEQAVNVLRDFSNKFPSLREFSTATIEQCRIQGYLTSLSGRCRLFPNINSAVFGLKAQSERQAVNFVIQGSAADICKAAMISTEEQLKGLNCKLLLQIHDELVWEVVDAELEQVKSIVKHVMEDTNTMCGKLIKLSVPLPVSISVGKNWGDMK